jgi:hypothetical protein
MKKTAVEWLVDDLIHKGIDLKHYQIIIGIAKEMEKEQHGKTWDAALDKYEVRAGNYMRAYEDFDD